jgi:predicted phosphate transport protein (TIGR00153 family)
MALFNFLKNDTGNFFQWFEDAANNTLQAAQTLKVLCDNYQDVQAMANRLHEYEHRGDEIGHRIYEQLHQSFITPLDREDIISLYSSIDDMTDFIHSAADMMAVYKVEAVPPIAKQLADCIVGCAQEVVNAVPHLRKRGELKLIQPAIIEINSLENQADDLLRAGLAELFDNPTDVVHLIKWRDIYQEMEQVTDRAEDIADVLRGLAIKNA